ncbi:MAG: type I glutamate--ammonia ligase [Rhodospirillaceae bacterium]|jgi:glutamine synthetase|nr:type I glutamate--ammonia ligase [Rhodospirillaceae bacterium]
MPETQKILELIKKHDVKFVDFRFTDLRGKWQHTAQHVSSIDEDILIDGILIDGSSIAGWKNINESDIILQPDLYTAVIDPFAAQTSLIIFCDIIEPSTGQLYDRDPRSVAKRSEKYLTSTGIGDTAFFGPEAEFFVFDDVRYEINMNSVFYKINSEEGSYVSGKKFPEGNSGHRPNTKGGYLPVPPVDSTVDIRAEMLTVMGDMGLPIEKHHHEVAPSQHELGCKYSTLMRASDFIQIYKYVVHNVAHSYGKTATFMPKPIFGDNGSGMHVHQSIWKNNKPTFAGSSYADLSETALYYIGGILNHAKTLNAFTNPLTNSYKRLIPGFEAPVLLAYSSRNRSASCRIPYSVSPKTKRVEVRFPDSGANPYLAFSSMLLAGIDGIQNKIHPGDAIDKNLYDLPYEELNAVPTVCGSLREALQNLEKDHDFLLKGDVFSLGLIDSYAKLKWEEVYKFEHMPHPIEYAMYYSV